MASIYKRTRNTRKPYVVRYRDDNGRQLEASFRTRKEAADFKAKLEYEQRAGIFTDPKLGTVLFTAYAAQVVKGMAVTVGTKDTYDSILRTWINPWAGDRTLRQVAGDREGVADLVNNQMRDPDGILLSYNRRSATRTILLAAVNEAVKAGRLNTHRLAGIKLIWDSRITERTDFVFPTHAQVQALASSLNGYGLIIWLMRGCGLRIREALAVHREDFRDHGTVLRVSRQASNDSSQAMPLKDRKPGEYRDIPVPDYLWEIVRNMPKGPLCSPSSGKPYFSYSTVYRKFTVEARKLGIPEGFTPHSLRHAFATALLSHGVPVHVVSQMLGHKGTEVTTRVYAHVIPSAWSQTRGVLNSEYSAWKDAPGMPAAA